MKWIERNGGKDRERHQEEMGRTPVDHPGPGNTGGKCSGWLQDLEADRCQRHEDQLQEETRCKLQFNAVQYHFYNVVAFIGINRRLRVLVVPMSYRPSAA